MQLFSLSSTTLLKRQREKPGELIFDVAVGQQMKDTTVLYEYNPQQRLQLVDIFPNAC